MFCKNCGAKLDEGSKFCSGCGMAVNAEGKSPETVAENPQPNPYMNQQAATMEKMHISRTHINKIHTNRMRMEELLIMRKHRRLWEG